MILKALFIERSSIKGEEKREVVLPIKQTEYAIIEVAYFHVIFLSCLN